MPDMPDHLVVAQDGRGVAVPGEVHRFLASGRDHRLVPEGGEGLLQEGPEGRIVVQDEDASAAAPVAVAAAAAVAAGPAAGARAAVASPPAAGRASRSRRQAPTGEASAPAIEAARTGRSNVNAAPRPQGDGAEPQVAAVRSHDRLRHGQAEPAAVVWRFGAEERLEQPVDVLGCDAAPVVHDGDSDPLVGTGLPFSNRVDPDPSTRASANGLDRVAGQVDEHLLDLATIELDRREVVGDIDLDLDRAGTEAARLQGEHAVDQGADGRRAPLRRSVGQEIQEVARDVLGPLGFRHQQFRVVPEVFRQGRSRRG